MLPNKKRVFGLLSVDNQGSSRKRSGSPVERNSSHSGLGQPETEANAPLTTLKQSLRALRDGSEVFPLLHTAVGTLLETFEVFQEASRNRRDSDDLLVDLTRWTGSLTSYISESRPTHMSKCVASVANDIKVQASHIKAQQARGRMRRLFEASDDREDLLRCYRRIERSFRQLQVDASLSVWSLTHEHIANARLGGLLPVQAANYDSSFSTKIGRGACCPNTRANVLEEIRCWVQALDGARIYWMNGMAGTGKTTIAYSLCVELEAHSRLGASFFCSRSSPECRDATLIIPTIAYQLARYSYPFQSALCRALGTQPDISKRNISMQFEYLIKEPLVEVKRALPAGLTVVIDALDELSDFNDTWLILDALLQHAAILPVKFFVTSRPEHRIYDKIMSHNSLARSVFHLHDIERSLVQEDIRTYLTVELAPVSPTAIQIRRLAERADNLFIYAATVVRYVCPHFAATDSRRRLATILELGTAPPEGASRMKIDDLYLAILTSILDNPDLDAKDVTNIGLVLKTVVCAKEPMTMTTLAELLGLGSRDEVQWAVHPLRSVLHVPEGTDLVSTFHASFPDFMLSQERSKTFFCDGTIHADHLAARCFVVMKQSLRFNICDLESAYHFDRDVPGLHDRVEAAISSSLFYASRYWGDHLHQATASPSLAACLKEFLDNRLLFWMEALNLKGWIGNAPAVLLHAQDWLGKSENVSDILEFAHDAQNFVATYAANPCSQSTPHIYVSMLPLLSTQRLVWKTYWPRTKALLSVTGSALKRQETTALATWEEVTAVGCIACSQDGARIVTGCEGGTICVWDAYNGNIVAGPFRVRAQRVCAVAFSLDKSCVASGFEDGTISLRYAHDGAVVTVSSDGHTGVIRSIVHSPSGPHFASGSGDCTVCIWEVHYRDRTMTAKPLIGHTGAVNSVAYSPDGSRIVSGSDDCTIRVWDAENCALLVGPLQAKWAGFVKSVAFSPDGERIVSGSHTGMVAVSDVHKGTITLGPFEAHERPVNSVAFSPNGARIISGSSDCTIRVWSINDAKLVSGPFHGHTCPVTAIAPTPDGTRIISSSYDSTIRVWDMYHRTTNPPADAVSTRLDRSEEYTWFTSSSVSFSLTSEHIACVVDSSRIMVFDGDDGKIISLTRPVLIQARGYQSENERLDGLQAKLTVLAFAPRGRYIASGSDRGEIHIWDKLDGRAVTAPVAHEGRKGPAEVKSLAFSRNGLQVVSGLSDGTICVWGLKNDKGRNNENPVDITSLALVARSVAGHAGAVNSIAYSPKSAYIASGSDDRTISIWKVQEDAQIMTGTRTFGGHVGPINSVAYSPNGLRVVSGSDDCTVRIWDTRKGTLLAGPFEGHTGPIRSVTFSSDGGQAISSSDGGEICMWDVHNGVGDDNMLPTESLKIPGYRKSDQLIGVTSNGTLRRLLVSDRGFIRVLTVPGCSSHLAKLPPPRAPSLQANGWVTDSDSRLLLWLPSSIRDKFPLPPDSLVISPEGVIRCDWTDFLRGESWDRCFMEEKQPPASD